MTIQDSIFLLSRLAFTFSMINFITKPPIHDEEEKVIWRAMVFNMTKYIEISQMVMLPFPVDQNLITTTNVFFFFFSQVGNRIGAPFRNLQCINDTHVLRNFQLIFNFHHHHSFASAGSGSG